VKRSILNLLSGLALCVLASACEHYAPSPPAQREIEADQGEVVHRAELVVLSQTMTLLDEAIVRSQPRGFRLLRRASLPDLGYHMAVLAIPPGISPAVAIQQIEALAPGVSAGLNHAYVQSQAGSPPSPVRRYADALLGWPEGGCPSHLAIGVIDSAIDSAEPALAGVAVQVQAFVADPVASAHGTAIAVTIAGEGRLRGAKIYNAVVMGAHQEHASAASVESVVRALDWLMSVDVGVVNISLEGPYNRILERSLQRAADLGVIIVASNGNAGPTSPPRYPAAFSDVIAVTAIDAALQVYPQAVRGPHTDLAAPGVDLFVSLEQSGRYLSGTSYAAALVTAAVAASPLPQRRPGASVLARLSAGARDLGDPGHDDRFGHGLPQVGGVCPG
jgi:hypothetical protein